MDLIRPHCFMLVAASRAPLQIPVTYLNTVVPRGAVFRLDYILVAYNRTVADATQSSPELLFSLKNSKGIGNNNPDLLFSDVTTPTGGGRVRSAWGWRIEFEPGEVITMEVRGMDAGPVPATVSVTYVGQKGWGRR